jgi:outer membrane protein assembly factor BamE
MKKTLFILAMLLTLSSCSLLHVHKMNIEQGNMITPDMTQQLHTGMSEERVRDIMGQPMVTNTFDNNRLEYVYTYKPGYGDVKEEYITLSFKRGVLKDIRGNMPTK